jgi:hypothetical protein
MEGHLFGEVTRDTKGRASGHGPGSRGVRIHGYVSEDT